MNGMILSAGLGTRFQPHSNILPKPAFPFLNVPLLYYSVFIAEKLGARKVAFNTHHLAGEIEKLVKNLPKAQFATHLSHEPEILGTGGCLSPVREHFRGETFFTLNADMVIAPSRMEVFSELVQFQQREQPLATLLVMRHPEAGKSYGAVWTDNDGKVLGFGKKPPRDGAIPYHYIGLRLFSPAVLDLLPTGASDIFYDVLTRAIADGAEVRVFVDDSRFYDGGNLKEFVDNTSLALSRLSHCHFLQAVAKRFWPDFSGRENLLHGSGTETLPDSVLTGNNVKVGRNVTFSGHCVLGDGVRIGDACRVENSTVAANVKISAGSHLKSDLVLKDL